MSASRQHPPRHDDTPTRAARPHITLPVTKHLTLRLLTPRLHRHCSKPPPLPPQHPRPDCGARQRPRQSALPPYHAVIWKFRAARRNDIRLLHMRRAAAPRVSAAASRRVWRADFPPLNAPCVSHVPPSRTQVDWWKLSGGAGVSVAPNWMAEDVWRRPRSAGPSCHADAPEADVPVRLPPAKLLLK